MSGSSSISTNSGNDTNLVAASFITEVLASAGRLEKDDLNAKLGKLSQRINEVKSEVYEALENEYEHFLPYLNVAPDLTERVNSMRQEVKEATDKIQTNIKAQLNTSTTEFQDLSRKLSESTHMSELLLNIMTLQQLDSKAFEDLQQKDFTAAGKSLLEMEQNLNNLSNHETYEEFDVKVLELLHTSLNNRLARLESELEETWRKQVKWALPTQKKHGKQQIAVSLTILSSDEAKTELRKTVQALEQMDLLEPKLKIFGKRFLEHVADSVITGNREVVTQNLTMNSKPCHELSLKAKKGKGKATDEKLPKIIKALFDSLNFVNDHLGEIEITDKDGKSDYVMEMLGRITSETLLTEFIDKCLAPAVPSNKSELQNFAKTVELTKTLQNSLIELGYIPKTEQSLVKYVESVNVLFANKKCLGILTHARSLMKENLHNTVNISNNSPHGEFPDLFGSFLKGTTKEEKTAANMAMSCESKLSARTFKFPTCKISVSCQQLVKLAYEVLFEASQSDTQCASQLFYAVRQMFELYATVVPLYHKENLVTLPQLAALHHNNCMYITHHMMTLKHQFEPHLPAPLKTSAATFIDLIPQIRRMGTDCFLKMMTQQKSQLLEYLSAANGFVGASESGNGEVADRAIRQCLHQLTHLANVWRPVLPNHIFTKSIGTLLRSVLEEVMRCIVALDDISADDATQLVMLLTVLIERAPLLYEEEEDEKMELDESDDKNFQNPQMSAIGLLIQSVPKWSQLTELHILLNAGLQQISDRWAEGKGPLAAEFSANEVKQLIRALFQNTDRRAAVLATIRQPVKK